MIEPRVEQKEDGWEVEYLYDLSFAPGREALSSYRLREGVEPVPELCLIMRDENEVLAAAIRFWPIRIGDQNAPALLLGPIAVHPTRQGEGLGGVLMDAALTKAKALGWETVVLVGDAPYYGRFGFEMAQNLSFPKPYNPERLLVKSLNGKDASAISGMVNRHITPTKTR